MMYETHWKRGSEPTPTLSFWWRIDDRGFPNFPEAQYCLFMYFDSDHTSGAMDIACALIRLLKTVDFEYARTVVQGFAHAITGAGSFALVLFDDGGWDTRHIDFALDAPECEWGTSEPPIRNGYHVIAHPRSYIKHLDERLYHHLMAVRLYASRSLSYIDHTLTYAVHRYLIDRRALQPELYPILGRRYQPCIGGDGSIRGADIHF